MRSPIRIAWRSGTMGVKLDECPACGLVTSHRLVRQYRWLEVGPIGLLPLGLRHGLECAECWTFSPLGWRQLRRAVRERELLLPERPRPQLRAAQLRGERLPELDRVVPGGSLDGGTFYLGVWAAVLLILLGLALQPAGREGEFSSTSTCLVTVGLAPGSPLPTPPMTVSQTLCVLPHNFEPLARIPLASFGPAATIPPYAVVVEQAAPACAAALKDAFGSPPPAGVTSLITGPDPRDWARGERFTWCAALDSANPWRTSSLPR